MILTNWNRTMWFKWGSKSEVSCRSESENMIDGSGWWKWKWRIQELLRRLKKKKKPKTVMNRICYHCGTHLFRYVFTYIGIFSLTKWNCAAYFTLLLAFFFFLLLNTINVFMSSNKTPFINFYIRTQNREFLLYIISTPGLQQFQQQISTLLW